MGICGKGTWRDLLLLSCFCFCLVDEWRRLSLSLDCLHFFSTSSQREPRPDPAPRPAAAPSPAPAPPAAPDLDHVPAVAAAAAAVAATAADADYAVDADDDGRWTDQRRVASGRGPDPAPCPAAPFLTPGPRRWL